MYDTLTYGCPHMHTHTHAHIPTHMHIYPHTCTYTHPHIFHVHSSPGDEGSLKLDRRCCSLLTLSPGTARSSLLELSDVMLPLSNSDRVRMEGIRAKSNRTSVFGGRSCTWEVGVVCESHIIKELIDIHH